MIQPAPTSESGTTNRPWWETRPFVALLILISAVPLLYPSIPPLVDLLGHMGRYRVELDLASSPWLKDYYGFHWAAIGNLGVDILIIPLGKIFGLELAVKLIVLAIPPMTVAGFLWVAREVHGRIPPTALFALPFAYGHPFMFGFVNFALSMALAFLAFGLWLRLARLGRLRLRAILFVPISLIVFFTHTFGWGVLGLLCFSAEAVRQHDSGKGWFRSGLNAALHASVMALPLLFMLVWRSAAHGGKTGDWFDLEPQVAMSSSRRCGTAGSGSTSAAIGVTDPGDGRSRCGSRRLTFSRNLVFSALVLFAGFMLLPYHGVQLRLRRHAADPLRDRGPAPGDPLSSRDKAADWRDVLAVLGLAFFSSRIVGNDRQPGDRGGGPGGEARALDHVPMGARVLSLVGEGCGNNWRLPRNVHLGAMTIVRRHGFIGWLQPPTIALSMSAALAQTCIGHADRRQQIRDQQCVDDETSTVLGRDGGFPELVGRKFPGAAYGFIQRSLSHRNDFDQRRPGRQGGQGSRRC